MSQRRSIMCPSCGDAIGTLLPEHNNMGIRCEHKVLRWTSREVGVDKKTKRPTFEHEPETVRGCYGVLSLCPHGCRVCAACPLQFEIAESPPTGPYVALAHIMRREALEGSERKAAEQQRERQTFASPQAKESSFVPPKGKLNLPFFGDDEPKRFDPRKKR